MMMLKEGDDDCLSVCVVCVSVPLGWLKMRRWIKKADREQTKVEDNGVC